VRRQFPRERDAHRPARAADAERRDRAGLRRLRAPAGRPDRAGCARAPHRWRPARDHPSRARRARRPGPRGAAAVGRGGDRRAARRQARRGARQGARAELLRARAPLGGHPAVPRRPTAGTRRSHRPAPRACPWCARRRQEAGLTELLALGERCDRVPEWPHTSPGVGTRGRACVPGPQGVCGQGFDHGAGVPGVSPVVRAALSYRSIGRGCRSSIRGLGSSYRSVIMCEASLRWRRTPRGQALGLRHRRPGGGGPTVGDAVEGLVRGRVWERLAAVQ
jgi:hypothetical protein